MRGSTSWAGEGLQPHGWDEKNGTRLTPNFNRKPDAVQLSVLDGAYPAGQGIARQNDSLVLGKPCPVVAQLGHLEPMVGQLGFPIVGHEVLEEQLLLILKTAQDVDVGIVYIGGVDVGHQHEHEADDDEVLDEAEELGGVEQSADGHLGRSSCSSAVNNSLEDRVALFRVNKRTILALARPIFRQWPERETEQPKESKRQDGLHAGGRKRRPATIERRRRCKGQAEDLFV